MSRERERGRLADLWKEAFPVGTEWDQYDRVYEIDWDFASLEEAFEEGGILHGKRVYLFGCTEPQLVWIVAGAVGSMKAVHIPAVVAVVSPFPPSDKVGIKSVQMEGENIVSMKHMKMDWVPYIPHDVTDHTSIERYKTQIFTLKCTQRKAALKQLKQERIKKYEYCLPYLYRPFEEDDSKQETTVSIMYSFDDEARPPVVTEYDWEFDELEEFTDNLIQDEQLPAAEKEKFVDHIKQLVREEKRKIKEAKLAKQKALADMGEDKKEALKNMKFYKFYPVKSAGAPDISELTSTFINRYYGKANEVFPPEATPKADGKLLWSQS